MRRVFNLFVLFVLLNMPIFAYGGAWEQAQDLCRQSGGNCNFNVPTPTPSIDRSHSNQPQSSEPKTYTKPSSPSLSPSESMTLGIFGSFLSGLFSGLFNFSDTTNNDDYIKAQKQKEYEEQQKLLMQKKQQALQTWHALRNQPQSNTQTTKQTQNTSLSFKTLGSSITPFKWQDKVDPKELDNSISLAQNQSQLDFNHELNKFFTNRLNDLVQEGGKDFLNKYHKSNITLAETLKERKKIKGLGKLVGDNAYENTLGIASIVVDYKTDGVTKALQSVADFLVLKIGIPQANFTLEAGRIYSRSVFNLLKKDLVDISNAVGMDFDYENFIKTNLTNSQKGVYDWLKGE